LVIFRSSKAAFYLRPLCAEKRAFSNDSDCVQFVQLTGNPTLPAIDPRNLVAIHLAQSHEQGKLWS
jgi:hypothetical protein